MTSFTRLALGLILSVSSSRLFAQSREIITAGDMATYFARVSDRTSENAWAETMSIRDQDQEAPKKSLLKRLKDSGPETAKHVGQNMLVLYIVAVVAGAAHEKQMAPLATDGADYSSLFVDLGKQMANNTSLYVSMLGAGATGFAGSLPAEAFEKVMEGLVGRNVLAHWFGHLAMGFVGNVGWEAGSRLWLASIGDLSRGLKTAEEREAAKAEMKLALAMPILKVLDGHGTPEEKRVLGKVLWKAFDRLRFADSKLSRQWLADTVRLNIATGPFLTMTASFATTGLIAKALVQTAIRYGLVGATVGEGLPGFAIGVGAALAGAAGSHLIPEKVNQAGTDGLRRLQIEGARYGLDDNRAKIHRLFSDRPKDVAEFKGLLADRALLRDVLGTAYFTQVYDPVTKYQSSTVLMNRACERMFESLDPNVSPLTKTFAKRKFKSRRRAEFFIREMLEAQTKEVGYLEAMLYRTNDVSARQLVRAQIDGVVAAHKALRLTTVGVFGDLASEMNVINIDRPTKARLESESNALINLFYLNGYEEGLFLPKTEAPGVPNVLP